MILRLTDSRDCPTYAPTVCDIPIVSAQFVDCHLVVTTHNPLNYTTARSALKSASVYCYAGPSDYQIEIDNVSNDVTIEILA